MKSTSPEGAAMVRLMRIASFTPRIDLFSLYEQVMAPEGRAPGALDRLVAEAGPELFSGHGLTGADGLRQLGASAAGQPLLRSEVGSMIGLDPRARALLGQQARAKRATEALMDGPFDRDRVEKAIAELFEKLAGQGLPLEPRPGSALAEAFATGDFSSFSDAEMLQLLVLMALYGRNRHKPGSVARQPSAALAPRGSWAPGGGGNRAGGGTEATGLNRPAPSADGPAPPDGELPPGTPIGQRLATHARRVANDMNSTGWCYRGVARAVASATGVQLSGGSAYMAADQLARSDRFREVQVGPDQLRDLPPGAVVVWGQTDRSPHGHISVALGNGQEASDHVQAQITSLRGASNYRVFVPND